ncbi:MULTISPECIES: proline dehydrogenase family protein [Bacillaceae]|jgi:proline dehydrogenase|uniref:proline dehydrogenase family protein n=1 Tax=Bacillaceae TaxID=186817 RepID=UPI00054DE663|nr:MULTISPECIES: proline dehydrogenase family protein [Bacillaceae]MBT2603249.1 proline dehydrogenase family protein [Bacillus sp. ISL-53]MCD1161355.1 proline dehydrogenase family protein [Peribacillus castrilensis]MDP9738738.1 proline dehydrogenase [Bacillus sp. B2I3]PCD07103.1 proline dehydrogenase [Peribacillus simplex]PEF34534.1 proline dehydrogenase [Bacillus sp. AFS094228]PEO41998.1 proline dehydrogenase [Bacillus sp. AFS026049]PHD76311.1 proline dehydrogenase [Bacillus sp. AFS043905]
MEAITRDFFLFLSKNNLLNNIAKKSGGNFAAGKIIGGTDFQSSIKFIKQLNNSGLSVTVDHLGEFVDSKEVTLERTAECIETIEMISREKLDSQVSLKMTSLGLDIDHKLVIENMTKILDTAEKHKVMVTIDMEDEVRCQATIDIFRQFKEKYSCISTVLQAYLFRTEKDLEDLGQYKPFLRLVKGAYKESPEVAFPEKNDVDENYKKLIKQSLLNGNYTAIASHDDKIIEYTKELAKKYDIPNTQFEFQMLYGMRNKTQYELVKQGYKMRVYVPYGLDWYGYFMRRLAERPSNIAFAFKGMVRS